MYVMYDSTELDQIPAHAQAAAGYTSGKWPTYNALVRRWPHAQHLSIAVDVAHDADCLDIENGDATPADAPGWFKRQRARGLAKPKLYCSLSVVPAVEAEMERAGIHRSEYDIWSAHYTGVPHICGPSEGLSSPADATQWTDKALGRNLDESLCSDAFFAPKPYVPADELRWEREYDALVHRKDAWASLRKRVLRRRMTARRKEIWHRAEAESGGWRKLNRVARWHSLKART
jgi:hypothetical protein